MTVRNGRIKATLPPEKIVRTDFLALALNEDKLKIGDRRLVDLACGHKALTAAKDRTICRRCVEMLQRSLDKGDEDYESYRTGERRDTMIWHQDPCRQFNEPTDLLGRFKGHESE